MRKTKFQNEYYYHIYNRGVDKRDIFCDKKDYLRFLRSMREFNQSRVKTPSVYDCFTIVDTRCLFHQEIKEEVKKKFVGIK